jgi:hypothetical protein
MPLACLQIFKKLFTGQTKYAIYSQTLMTTVEQYCQDFWIILLEMDELSQSIFEQSLAEVLTLMT